MQHGRSIAGVLAIVFVVAAPAIADEWEIGKLLLPAAGGGIKISAVHWNKADHIQFLMIDREARTVERRVDRDEWRDVIANFRSAVAATSRVRKKERLDFMTTTERWIFSVTRRDDNSVMLYLTAYNAMDSQNVFLAFDKQQLAKLNTFMSEADRWWGSRATDAQAPEER